MVYRSLLLILALAGAALADTGYSSTIQVTESDNSPMCQVGQLKFTAGTVTCSGGSASITSGGASFPVSQNVSFSDTSLYGILASTWSDSASTGTVGEYRSNQLASTNCPTSGVWADACTLTLSSGNWIVSGNMTFNGATNTEPIVGISTVSGNNVNHLRQGVDRFDATAPTANYDTSQPVPAYMVRHSTPTVYYEKVLCVYGGGVPKYFCTLQAWRPR